MTRPDEHAGRRRLSASRALVLDVLRLDQRQGSFVHNRQCHLSAVAQARQAAVPKISWSLVFLKAGALLARRYPVLRQSWVDWPWPHVYQHADNVGVMAVSRPYQGQERLFWLRIRRPEQLSLPQLQERLDRCRPENLRQLFRKQILASYAPGWIRRLGWWWTRNVALAKRGPRIGTYALTTLAGQGTTIDHPPSIHTATWTYGPMDETGHCRVALAYDHRLLDGCLAAQLLAEMELLLNHELADELRRLSTVAGTWTRADVAHTPHSSTADSPAPIKKSPAGNPASRDNR